MQLTINLPEKLTEKVYSKWGDLSQKIIDKLILEAFLEGLINFDEFKEMLDLNNDVDLKAFLETNIPLHNSGLLNLAGSCADIDFTTDNLAISDQIDNDLISAVNEQ
ncbi:MAG: hypothetical protein F6K40_20280 [Okeania sp. SIO3I5]|uniref:hypothetical protein n=1 Tax=Okeania sp. SIO3I5 TaxID=2607805 RepID=UPI0013BB3D85|nr:hypothetical protein [Okeania sp. SIO3I5]NEQ38478.1 hypothetical protein [Okeania sp. SIO3I5]